MEPSNEFRNQHIDRQIERKETVYKQLVVDLEFEQRAGKDTVGTKNRMKVLEEDIEILKGMKTEPEEETKKKK